MNKSIVVIDTPKNCWECRMVDSWEHCDAIKITANKYGMKITEFEHSRPSWCPLIPIDGIAKIVKEIVGETE